MAKVEFKYSKEAVNRAGIALIGNDSTLHDGAKAIIDNWRACHAAPLNSFQTSLRQRLKQIDPNALVSQRLKRMPSIVSKLERNPGMNLARMQDIGGIRAVVSNMKEVRELESYYKKGTKAFSIAKGGKDYINTPKDSGYRSVHQIFKCKNGFSIELQIRTQIQHSWATAVETVGTFLNHSLKSSEGPEEWLKFFSLASSAFSILESTPRVGEFQTLTDEETFDLLLKKERELDVINKLSGFRVAAKHISNDQKKGKYHLIILDLENKYATINSFEPRDIQLANKKYSEIEAEVRRGRNAQVVLVASESISTLKKAYPSYFLDSQNFIKNLDAVKKQLKKMQNMKRKSRQAHWTR
ncbi:RelA/SpoT domain-containing protein (plasmid) [Chromobacterium amazonense]|uniref:RelA/SpoT domain-containing protein n=1 Tax=Chromobacterium amazonense TaxID=1382803 RepID=UPI00237E477D|nr:RelA/SpoT domain-containing protein [Chromobacterium amazonense]MDE1714907.1 RelA/SpoT domain-containing protein [Chromobacterium amazonense]